ncbi:ABC transporter G family member 20 [Topomyia yanbarensis]|uniref:ABC transporter G family member 20 n=1 Tax=Topomyia yanbarensis TaxID=2498891 RepID=UPI00273C23CE|nr:ABC transporter G family member 20 [Topomyia yanbarensis]XP_058824505.1 ABC transporter G family member 20 [Topomyia yanbarensis]
MDVESEGVQPVNGTGNGHTTFVIDNSDESHRNSLSARRRMFMSQPSTVAIRRQQAVCVRRAHKIYGTKKNPNVVLDGLNMTVPKGSIYGLLGASGCGKTTLLSCIVGRRRLNSGEIWVLGGRPGSRGSGVPGPRIGYMPQELALYGEFTIRETLIYFGWICGLTVEQVDEKTDFLLKLLQMPNASRFVKNLSGGQQRRMSLAAALLHSPELLILDEPTVGVDPVLRQNIWDHLVEIVKNSNTTVIITTHYIEETRQAHVIGLMRGGKFLAEESPSDLLAHYHSDSLEDVFLKLSVMQNMGKRRRSSIAQEVVEAIRVPAIANPALDLSPEEDHGEISGEFGDNISMSSRGPDSITPEIQAPPLPPEEDTKVPFVDHFKILKPNHMRALIWKNFLWMWRNVGVMAFIIGLPVGQIVLFCWAIGHDPVGLKVAVANYELEQANLSATAGCPVTLGCNHTLLSCRYLASLRNRSVDIEMYESEAEAIEQVNRGKAWASMVFAHNYSEALYQRSENIRKVHEWTLDMSSIMVSMDMSNQQIGTLLYRDIQYAYFSFIEKILTDCDVNPSNGRLPIQWNQPIYGEKTPNFTDFAAPGVILTIIFFLSVALTSGAMLIERNEGILERCLVMGVTGVEFLFSHVTTQFLVMCGQTTLVILFSFYVFDISNKGDIVWVVLLTILTGLCGMCFGFVVSCSCDNERSATYLAMGSFLPIVMLCGIIWPIEGMHPLMKIFSVFLPLTKSTESLRSMLQRGWHIQNPNVYIGFAATGTWIVIFLAISILLLKFKKG